MPQEIYNIEHTGFVDGQLVSEVSVNAAHSIFEGHFPGSPVTPGVIQMQMVRDILAQHLGRPLRLKALRTCKFLEILDPAANPLVTINIKYKAEELVEVSATGQWGSTVFFKMQATYVYE